MDQIPSTLADLKASLTVAMPTDPFGLAYMQLCGLSYENRADIPRLVANPAYVTPWGDGRWACVWGPAQDSDNANLAYIAAYYDRGTGLPVAAVLVIRGTDITDNVWGDLWEAFEDLQVPYQYRPSWLPSSSPARVAGGTLDAVQTITGLLYGSTIQEFLTAFLGNPANQKPVLVVTGHSLGGCLTTVLAPWLRIRLAANGVSVPIVPATFAAPTAGNQAYADYLGATFQYAPRYYNTLDMVPHGWAGLDGVMTLYDDYGLSTPLWVDGVVEAYKEAIRLGGASYAQPACAGTLTGSFCMGFSWLDEISTQHDHRTYIALMQGVEPQCYLPMRPRNRHYSPEERDAALGDAAETVAITAIPEPPAAG